MLKLPLSTRARIAVAMAVVLALNLVGFQPPPPTATNSKPGHKVYLVANPQDNFFRLAPPASHEKRSPSAALIVNYVGSWDAQAQTAFQYAADIWAGLLVSSIPIVIEAEWNPLGGNILGGAGPATFYWNFPGAPQNNVLYPVALANALSGQDLNNANPEVYAEFSSNFSNWYFGIDGNTPSGQYDFVSVVLHEIGHGLGFSGTMIVSNGVGRWGFGTGLPDTYDRYPENLSGQLLISFPNYSTALTNQLTGGGGGLYFDGPNAVAANGGNRPRLYTPSTWQGGSSYAHLDENTYSNTPNALMTPSISSAESLHDPGPITLGILQDLGWSLAGPPPRPNLAVTQQLHHELVAPGDAITVTITVQNNGAAQATNIILTNPLDSDILSPAWTNSASLNGMTAQGGSAYTWHLPDLPAGASGTVTVLGTLNPGLPAEFAILHQASIATTEEETSLSDNQSTIILGGVRVYLPLMFR